jgi:hypothetical protein
MRRCPLPYRLAHTVAGYAKLTATKASEAVDRCRRPKRSIEYSRR